MRKIIASLDLGSNMIKLVIGEVYKNKLNILACISRLSRGIKKGFIINSESFIEEAKEIFLEAENMIGLPVKKVIISVPSNHLETFYSEGKININSEDGVIRNKDLLKSMLTASSGKVADNYELIHLFPTSFVLDSGEKVMNPVDYRSTSLKAKVVGLSVPKKNIYPILECLKKIGVEVIDEFICPIGDYFALKNEETKDSVGAIINLGHDKTEVSIFNKGILTSSGVLDTGGENIDNDISYVYKIDKKESNNLKETLAIAYKNFAKPSESTLINNKNNETIKINQYNISELSEARLEEILNLVKKQINLLTKKEISYIYFTGGLTEFSEFDTLLEETFNHKAKVGNINVIGARDNKFSTNIGLIYFYLNKLKMENREFSIFSIEEQEDLSGLNKKISISDNSLLGKIFGYFFDN